MIHAFLKLPLINLQKACITTDSWFLTFILQRKTDFNQNWGQRGANNTSHRTFKSTSQQTKFIISELLRKKKKKVSISFPKMKYSKLFIK